MDTDNSNSQQTETQSTEPAVVPEAKAESSTPRSQNVKEPTLKEEISKITSTLATNPLYPEVSYILSWRDPIRTGLLFGIFNFAFFLVTYGEYSVLSLVAYCALALLVAAFAYANGSVLFAKYIQGLEAENPLGARWSNAEPIPRYVVEKHLDSIVNFVNAVLDVSRDVFYCNFPFLSIKVGTLLFVLSLIGKWLSGFTLLYIAAVVAFGWPRLYEEKKSEIDQYWKLVTDLIDTYTQLALSKIPKLDKKKTQ